MVLEEPHFGKHAFMDSSMLRKTVRGEVGKVYRGRVDLGQTNPKGAYFAGDGRERVHRFGKPLLIVHSILCSPQNNLRPKRQQP